MVFDVYFSLGTNMGDRKLNIEEALKRMDASFGQHYEALSDVMETEPWGFHSENMFLNCAVKYRLGIPCEDILHACKTIEAEMGRPMMPLEYDTRGERIYRSRIIDIDILFYGEQRIDSGNLKVPHPLMQERDFVMIPLRQIASEKIRRAFPDIFREI